MDDDIHRLPDKVQIREDTPEDLKVAIETFFEATKMIKEGYVEKMPGEYVACLLYTSPSPRDQRGSRMPSSA